MTQTGNLTTDMPTVDDEAGGNWANIALDAWLAEHGGADVTGDHGEGDYGDWVGDVDYDGNVYRLTVDGQSRMIVAAPLDEED